MKNKSVKELAEFCEDHFDNFLRMNYRLKQEHRTAKLMYETYKQKNVPKSVLDSLQVIINYAQRKAEKSKQVLIDMKKEIDTNFKEYDKMVSQDGSHYTGKAFYKIHNSSINQLLELEHF